MKSTLSTHYLFILFFLLLAAINTTNIASAAPLNDSHGETVSPLQISKTGLHDDKQQRVVLKGVSFFWSNSGWQGARFYQPQVVDYFVDKWGVNLVRAAVGIDADGGLIDDPENQRRAERVIKRAIQRGIYVIIDFHSHHAEEHTDRAIAFFQSMAKKYGQYPNVIYEIYNEPLPGADWQKVIKPYAEKVISAIRRIDSDNLILVGTRSWSQDVDEVIGAQIADDNLAYTLHFYAGSHHADLMDKARTALKAGIPLFVSEWGSVAATGDGDVDESWSRKWDAFMNKHHLSRAVWAVSDKNEASAIFEVSPKPVNHIEQFRLTKSGKLAKELIRGR